MQTLQNLGSGRIKNEARWVGGFPRMTQRHGNNGIAYPSRVSTQVLGTMHVCTAISAIGDVVAEIPLLVDSIETCHRSPGPRRNSLSRSIRRHDGSSLEVASLRSVGND
jgi:hypothetical protein